MYWWIKDVFVERDAYPEQQQHSRHRVRFPAFRKSWSNLKQHVRLNIEQRRTQNKIRQSHDVLSKLSDHYLADIGLRRIDLNAVAKGSYPGPYQQSAPTNVYQRPLKVVNGTKKRSQSGHDIKRNSGYSKKAA